MKISSSSPAASRALSPLIVGCLAVTWLVWGSTYLVIRFALVGFAPYFLMATRFMVAGGLLFAWQLARGASVPTVREWLNALLVGALMLGGGWVESLMPNKPSPPVWSLRSSPSCRCSWW